MAHYTGREKRQKLAWRVAVILWAVLAAAVFLSGKAVAFYG